MPCLPRRHHPLWYQELPISDRVQFDRLACLRRCHHYGLRSILWARASAHSIFRDDRRVTILPADHLPRAFQRHRLCNLYLHLSFVGTVFYPNVEEQFKCFSRQVNCRQEIRLPTNEKVRTTPNLRCFNTIDYHYHGIESKQRIISRVAWRRWHHHYPTKSLGIPNVHYSNLLILIQLAYYDTMLSLCHYRRNCKML